MKPGDRVRMNEQCPWPERVGCEGVIVAPRADRVYPQPPKWEVIVLLDNDPLGGLRNDEGFAWTCCIRRKAVDLLTGQIAARAES